MIEQTLFNAGIVNVAGVDEAGRGPCAGPLVVAAVILKDPFSNELSQVKDSKELTEAKREKLFEIIIENCIDYNIVEITPDEIDQLGLHKCNIEG
ncbi:MAG: ribonuclease HII, partial [bacterium]